MGIKSKIKYLSERFNYNLKVIYTYIFFKATYKIKRGYIHKSEYNYFDDTSNTDNWQLEVYTMAKEYVEKEKLNSVIDFGCGSAYKLIKYFNGYNTTGIDVSPTYEFLIEKYPNGNWLKFGDFDMNTLSADIVICSDVIEHVLDPDDLLNNIKKIQNVKYIFISTPDRSLMPTEKFGPPFNPSHVREWSFEELKEYIGSHFEIVDHIISNKRQWTQLIIVKNKN